MRPRKGTIPALPRRLALMAAMSLAAFPAVASPEQCASHWIERNRPFAERGLCVDTPLWKAVFPGSSCTHETGADISLPPEVADRLSQIRLQETQLGCRIDNDFSDPKAAAKSLWLDTGDRASIFSAKDGYANLRDAPSAKSGKLVGMLENGSQLRIVERVQSPDNEALWFRVSYADNTGRLHMAFVHHATVFPRREVIGFFDTVTGAQLELISLGGEKTPLPLLRARFWTEKHPSDIWPVLSHPTYMRSGEEQRSFSVAFTALDWGGDEASAIGSKCQWQDGKRHADCSGSAGEFRIVATRDDAGALRALGLQLDNSKHNSVNFAGFDEDVSIAAISGNVQLGIVVDGLETLKNGIFQPGTSAPSQPAAPAEQQATPSEQQATPSGADAPASAPQETAEDAVDFDALLDMTE